MQLLFVCECIFAIIAMIDYGLTLKGKVRIEKLRIIRKRRDAILQNVTTHCVQVENIFWVNA